MEILDKITLDIKNMYIEGSWNSRANLRSLRMTKAWYNGNALLQCD